MGGARQKAYQEYTEELYQKDLDIPNNPDSVAADLEPEILESEVKWALESMANNEASGGDGIPIVLLKILKDVAVKMLHSICQQTTGQLHLFHTLARLCSKSSKVGFSSMWTENSQKYKLDSEEAEAVSYTHLTLPTKA